MTSTSANITESLYTSDARLRSSNLSKVTGDLESAGVGDKITKAAEEFEQVFISEMLNHMFSGVAVDKTFGGGQGEETWRSLLVNEYAKVVGRTGGIGLADSVKQEMIRLQESAHA